MIRLTPAILLMAASLAAQTPQALMEAKAREIKSLSATNLILRTLGGAPKE